MERVSKLQVNPPTIVVDKIQRCATLAEVVVLPNPKDKDIVSGLKQGRYEMEARVQIAIAGAKGWVWSDADKQVFAKLHDCDRKLLATTDTAARAREIILQRAVGVHATKTDQAIYAAISPSIHRGEMHTSSSSGSPAAAQGGAAGAEPGASTPSPEGATEDEWWPAEFNPDNPKESPLECRVVFRNLDDSRGAPETCRAWIRVRKASLGSRPCSPWAYSEPCEPVPIKVSDASEDVNLLLDRDRKARNRYAKRLRIARSACIVELERSASSKCEVLLRRIKRLEGDLEDALAASNGAGGGSAPVSLEASGSTKPSQPAGSGASAGTDAPPAVERQTSHERASDHTDKLTAELSSTKRALEDAEATRARERDERARMEEDIRKLEAKLKEQQEQAAQGASEASEATIADLTTQRDEFKQRLDEEKAKTDDLQSKLEASSAEVSGLQEAKGAAEEEIRSLKTDRGTLQSSLDGAEAENTRLTRAMQQAKEQAANDLHKAQADAQAKQVAAEDLQKQMDSIKAELDKALIDASAAISSSTKTKEQLQAAEKAADEARSSLAQAQADLQAITRRATHAESSLDAEKSAKQKVKSDLEELRSLHERVGAELADMQRQASGGDEVVRKLQEEKEAASKQRNDERAAVQAAQETIRKLSDELDATKAELTQANTRAEANARETEEQASQLQAMVAELDQQKQSCTGLTASLARAQSEHKAATKRHNERVAAIRQTHDVELEAARKRLHDLMQEKNDAEDAHAVEVRSLKSQLDQGTEAVAQLEIQRSDLIAAKAEIETLTTQLNAARQAHRDAGQSERDLAEEVARLREAKRAVDARAALLEQQLNGAVTKQHQAEDELRSTMAAYKRDQDRVLGDVAACEQAIRGNQYDLGKCVDTLFAAVLQAEGDAASGPEVPRLAKGALPHGKSPVVALRELVGAMQDTTSVLSNRCDEVAALVQEKASGVNQRDEAIRQLREQLNARIATETGYRLELDRLRGEMGGR